MITKLEYLRHFFNNRGYEAKGAIQSIISIQFEDPESSGVFKTFDHAVWIEGGTFKTNIDGSTVDVEGNVDEAFSVMDTRYDFPGDFHPMLRGKAITSTFGLMLFNLVLFWEPFGDKVEYINKSLADKKMLEGLIAKLMVDNPKEGETLPADKASVDACLQFSSNGQFLHGLGIWYIKPGGVDALTVSPEILKRKDELIAELKAAGKLSDPVAVTAMIEELVEMDRKVQLAGPSRNFYIADKYISTARKRMFLAFGIEQNPTGDGWVFLSQSLNEGIDPTQIVTYVNTAVAGAYSRSMATGEGGSRVKDALRLIGRSVVEGDDCGSPVFEWITVSDMWMGGYFISDKGVVQITKDNINTLQGHRVKMRVPQYCRQIDGNFCKTCLGERLGLHKNRLSAEVVRMPTEAMLTRMKAHHQAGLNTRRIDLRQAIK